jgi:succinyl-CoA synthetase beta subunit
VRLFEYESKALLSGRGITVPKGVVLENVSLQATLPELKFPCILKVQVPVGGRGKAGGVVIVNCREEAERQLDRLFSLTIGGFPVSSVLAEEVVGAGEELYLALLVDRSERCYTLIAGSRGGADIEQVAKDDPGSILRVRINPLEGISDTDLKTVASHFNMNAEPLLALVRAAYGCFLEEDAELLEINPLVKTQEGLVALDAKVVIDDNALFRHPLFKQLPPRGKSHEELEAEAAGLNYVSLDGCIGIIANGAGLTMATMDLVKEKGGNAANFLDLGAGARSEQVAKAINFLCLREQVRGILVNIFGGMTRCDEVAKGIAAMASGNRCPKPIVVRLIGTNQRLGAEILRGAGIDSFKDPHKAAEKIVALAGSRT